LTVLTMTSLDVNLHGARSRALAKANPTTDKPPISPR
jgi:hypothetical protein